MFSPSSSSSSSSSDNDVVVAVPLVTLMAHPSVLEPSLAARVPPPLVLYPGSYDRPFAPLSEYITIFWSFFRMGFRQRLSWVMMELCEELQIAPSNLCPFLRTG